MEQQSTRSRSKSRAAGPSSCLFVSEQKTNFFIRMGFDIPEPYCWDESFKVFYDNLDEEHRGLFKGIFAVSKAPGDGAALATLKKKVDEHFHNEEAMMKKANYPDLPAHSQLHADFVKKLSAVATPVSTDTVNFAKEWLVNHIKATDHKYINKL